jgi:site-specific recombinase XerD
LARGKNWVRHQNINVIKRVISHPVRLELSEQTREAADDYIRSGPRRVDEFLFPSRRHTDRCPTTRQYGRLVSAWIDGIDLDAALYGTHSLRRTKAPLIYRRTGNLRAVQLLLGHRRIDYVLRRTMSRPAVTRLIINTNGQATGT